MAKPSNPRIPLELQKIFLASNGGATVDAPPPGLGFKVFKRVFPLASFKKNKNKKAQRKNSLENSFKTLDSSSRSCLLSSPTSSAAVDEYESPQTLLESMLCERGYSTKKYKAAETSFRFKPTQYELASYNSHSLEIVTEDRTDHELEKLLIAGISPNACNRDAELLMHKACRLGKHQHVRLFLKFGADLKVCSASGRTALHDACGGQRPAFQTFALIVEADPSLVMMMDVRGKCPLEYIRKDHYVFWFEYLERNVDKFWPMQATAQKDMSPADLGSPFTRTLSKPANALPPELAHVLATGKMTTKEVSLLLGDDASQNEDAKEPVGENLRNDASCEHFDESSSSDSSSDTSESSSDDGSSSSYDELFSELGIRL